MADDSATFPICGQVAEGPKGVPELAIEVIRTSGGLLEARGLAGARRSRGVALADAPVRGRVTHADGRRLGALCLLISCGDSSHSASERREAPPAESDADRRRREVVENPDVVHMLSAARPWLTDHHVSDRFAAIEVRRPGEELVLEWAKRHLGWEALQPAEAMSPAVELGRNTVLDGRLACITGQLATIVERDGAWELTLTHPTCHLTEGVTDGSWCR